MISGYSMFSPHGHNRVYFIEWHGWLPDIKLDSHSESMAFQHWPKTQFYLATHYFFELETEHKRLVIDTDFVCFIIFCSFYHYLFCVSEILKFYTRVNWFIAEGHDMNLTSLLLTYIFPALFACAKVSVEKGIDGPQTKNMSRHKQELRCNWYFHWNFKNMRICTTLEDIIRIGYSLYNLI